MPDPFFMRELSSDAMVTVLKEKVRKLKHINKQIKHDIREQLFVIKNSLQILKLREYEKFDEKTKSDFERLNRAVARLEYKVENITELAPSSLVNEKILVTNVIRTVIDRMHVPKTVSINITGDSVAIQCEQRKLQIVFLNLILNAIQAMKSHGIISITTEDDDRYVIISIKDSGPGIPPDKSSKIFNPSYTTRPTGTGLGLASCKNIIERFGGTIRLEPKKGKGAIFVIRLPKNNRS